MIRGFYTQKIQDREYKIIFRFDLFHPFEMIQLMSWMKTYNFRNFMSLAYWKFTPEIKMKFPGFP